MADTPASEQEANALDATLGLKMVSLRLPVQLIEDFKAIAAVTNSPYQAIMRKCLVTYAEIELMTAGREYLLRKRNKGGGNG